MKVQCGFCGQPATGLASIGETRYCHGDDDKEPTCYERAQWGDPVTSLLCAIFGKTDEESDDE